MNPIMLEVAQMLKKHPIIVEDDVYKSRYLNALEYFVRKYAANDIWAHQTLQLYTKYLLNSPENYAYNSFEIRHDLKRVINTKFRHFKFFSYRYCLIIDCIYICAFQDNEKAKQIYEDLTTGYRRWHRNKLHLVFESLYDHSVDTNEIEQIQDLKWCWDANTNFVSGEPIKIIITANMSAGKSTLINALVGKKVSKTQNEACTAKVHHIVNKPYEDGLCYEWDHLLELDADYHTLMDDNVDNASSQITVGAFFRTLNQPCKRIELIDTPGVNSSQNAEHKSLAEKAIQNTDTDLMIFLLNGTAIGTDDDRKHLQFVLENYHGKILFVVNKLDTFRKNEDSIPETLHAVEKDLSDIGFKFPQVVPVSAYAAFLAKEAIFECDLEEDERDELELLARRMKRPEHHLEAYYPDSANVSVTDDNSDSAQQLLLHSGLLNLENIIYNMR